MNLDQIGVRVLRSGIVLFLTISLVIAHNSEGWSYVDCRKIGTCPGFENTEEVLIYYANETAPDDNERESYQTVIAWLKESGDKKALKVAKQIERDLKDFSKSVDQEVSLLVKKDLSHSHLNIVIFTNRLARKNRVLVRKNGDAAVQQIPFKPAKTDDYILASNPLSMSLNLELALKTACKIFNPEKFHFILITKSHGNDSYALTPRLHVRTSRITQKELLDLLHEKYKERPEWARRIGVTKDQYYGIIKRAGEELGMLFDLVFLESCHSGKGEFFRKIAPGNVSCLCTIKDKGTRYLNIDYTEILNHHNAFAAALKRNLVSLKNANPKASKSTIKIDYRLLAANWYYFLPLLLTIIWISVIIIRNKAGRRLRQTSNKN